MSKLLKVGKDGSTFLSSLSELRREFPNVSFPSNLVGMDLSPYGYLVSNEAATGQVSPRQTPATRVSMAQFLYGLRDFGLRVQFENYIQHLEGHARDYWLTSPYVNRGHVCVKHLAEFFQLTQPDLDAIFTVAGSIEE